MVDVQQRSLRALEQNRRATLHRPVHHEADVFRERQQSLRKAAKQLQRLLDVGAFRAPELSELCIRVFCTARHQLAKASAVP